MSIISINLVVLRVPDLGVAERFYGALGLEFHRHAHGSGLEHCAADVGSSVFEIYPLAPKDNPTTSTRIGFTVTRIDETIASAIKVGGRVISAPKDSEWGKRAVLADPFEHRIELIETAKSKPHTA